VIALRSLLQKVSRITLLRNMTSLYLVQIANYVIPLFTLPFLARALGVGGMGVLATLQLLAVYGVVITEYGFQYSATRKVALLRNDRAALAALYSAVTVARLLLAVVATGLLVLCSLAFDYIPRDPLIYATLLIMLVANALTPLWFLQGLERMEFVALANLVSRTLVMILVFVIVRPDSPLATLLAFATQAVGQVASAAITLGFIARVVPLALSLPGLTNVRDEFRDGWLLFRTTFLSYTFSNVATFALGLTTTREAVGGFAAADRLAKAVLGLFGPISQAIYPRMSTHFAQNYRTGWTFFRRWALRALILGAVLTGALALFAPSVMRIAFGPQYVQYAPLLAALLGWALLNLATTFIGVQYLNNVGQSAAYARRFNIYVLSVAAGMLLAVPLLGGLGAACVMVGAELLLLVLLVVLMRTNHAEASVERH